MTTEIDAEGLAAAAEAIDTLWSDGQDRGPAFADTEREYQEHCRSTARAAITAYLATARTSEAEPVALGAIRICPERDGPCPHGDGCQFSQDRYHCDLAASRTAMRAPRLDATVRGEEG